MKIGNYNINLDHLYTGFKKTFSFRSQADATANALGVSIFANEEADLSQPLMIQTQPSELIQLAANRVDLAKWLAHRLVIDEEYLTSDPMRLLIALETLKNVPAYAPFVSTMVTITFKLSDSNELKSFYNNLEDYLTALENTIYKERIPLITLGFSIAELCIIAPKLRYVNCRGLRFSNEAEIDTLLKSCSNAHELLINSDKLTKFKHLPATLQSLDCEKCRNLLELNLSNYPSLQELYCSHCPLLKTLNYTNHQKLQVLECSECPSLSELKLSNCKALERLYCYKCPIRELDCSNCPKLHRIDCTECEQLNVLTLTNCKGLRRLFCFKTNIEKLDCSHCPELEAVGCSNCSNLKEVDCSNCQLLEDLLCFQSYSITSLNVINCQKLKKLDCYYFTELTKLNLTNCIALEEIDCHDCRKLNELKFSDCRALKKLNCSNCPDLRELDLSNCRLLQELDCSACDTLSELKAANLPALKLVTCCNCNLLTKIDCSYCPRLGRLDCFENNMLTEISLSNCQALEEFRCYMSPLLETIRCASLPRCRQVDYNNCPRLMQLPQLPLGATVYSYSSIDFVSFKVLPDELETQPLKILGFLGEIITKIQRMPNIVYLNSPGLDGGGLRRQLVSTLMQNLFEKNSPLALDTEEGVVGVLPHLAENNHDQILAFKALGRLIALSALGSLPLGRFLRSNFYYALLNLEEEDLREFNEKLAKKITSLLVYGVPDEKIEAVDQSLTLPIALAAKAFREMASAEYYREMPLTAFITKVAGLETTWENFNKLTEYKGVNKEIVKGYFKTFFEKNPDKVNDMIELFTASRALGEERIKIFTVKKLDVMSLISISTCFQQVNLPPYPTYKLFEEKLLKTIEHTLGQFDNA